MKCAQCGKEIPADSEFCGYCGATVAPAAAPGPEQAAAASSTAAPPPPPPPAPPAGGPPPPAQTGVTPPAGTGLPPGQYGPPEKKSPLPWILGIVGIVVVVAVVLVLVFVVFKGDDNGGADEGPANTVEADEGPANTVEAFFESLQEQDARMLVGTMEPAFVEDLEDILGEDFIDLLDEYFFAFFLEDFRANIEKMETTIDGDTAEVLITEGTLSYTEDGERITEEAAKAGLDEFELVRVDGKWYLEEDFLIDMGFDFSDLEDYDYDELDFDDGYSDDFGVTPPIDSEDEALLVVFEDPDILDWYMETDGALFDITDENTSYVVYLYELDEDFNEIPYGYYAVDKETGELSEVVE